MATMTLPESETKEAKKSSTKYVYSFGGGKADGNGKMKDVLGGKGAGLAEMTNAGLPVPPGFTIQTEACREYMRGKLSPFQRRLLRVGKKPPPGRGSGVFARRLADGLSDRVIAPRRCPFSSFAEIRGFEK